MRHRQRTSPDVLEETLLTPASTPRYARSRSRAARAPSKSKTLAERLLDALAKLCTRLIDVATLPAEALVVREQSVEIDDASPPSARR